MAVITTRPLFRLDQTMLKPGSQSFKGASMKSHARVGVIGGGVVGCSVLYHLTKFGWKDVVLCERKELTAGSSWHAAGGFHALNSDPQRRAAAGLHHRASTGRSRRLSGQDVGLHFTGGLNVAATRDRWDFLRADCARHRVLGPATTHRPPRRSGSCARSSIPHGCSERIYDPVEGHLDPYGATHAFAKAARLNGAEIYRHTRVVELVPSGEGTWQRRHGQGNHRMPSMSSMPRASGRAKSAYMVGVELPVVPMEHHYLLTEDLPELKQLEPGDSRGSRPRWRDLPAPGRQRGAARGV